MPFIETGIPGVVIFEPKVFEDERGYFFEGYNAKIFEEAGIKKNFVQDNQSRSNRGVLRGLHYQLAPYAQSKLVRVLSGVVYDVAVDIRKNSPYYGKWVGVELSGENKRQFYIPAGFAHGFVVESGTAEFFYKCDQFYRPESERGILFNDPSLNINWRLSPEELALSPKDKILPVLSKAENNFVYGEF